MLKSFILMTLVTSTLAVAQPLTPPVAPVLPHVVKSPRGERVDEYHWLRDDDARAKRPEILQHLEAENAYTDAMLAPLAELRRQLVAEMRGRIVEDDSTPPVYDQGFWYWTEFKTGDEYPRLMRRRGTPERPETKAPRELLLDQPARARGLAYYKVASTAVSPDGRWLAWTEDTAGRRVHTLRFRNLVTGQDHADAIPGVLEELAWANDNRTLFYILQDPVTLQSGPVYRHVLGTDTKTDVKVYDEDDKTLFTEVRRSASGRFVVIDVRGTDTAETLAVPADKPAAAARVVLARREQVRHRADHLRGRWVVRTNEGALNFRLVSAPERAPDVRSLWRTLLPGRELAKLEAFVLTTRGIAVQERVDADVRVRLLGSGARVAALAAPAGTAVTLGDNRDAAAAHLRFDVTSMVRPTATYDLHLQSGQAVLRKEKLVPGYDAALYATTRLWAPSRDGKRIPVTLSWRRDRAQADGSAPMLVLGYGSYGHSIDPHFSSNRPSLMDRGFVVAFAHVRGGADLGEAWYADGRMMNKHNSFNDFVDATQALLQAGWGAPGRVFAQGGSAGGLLMGAVANQAGALYRGMVLDVPFVDVVTTMLDETIPLTANEWTQWGDPRQKAAYDYMLGYSPYDNIQAKDYPAMLVTTGLWDSQVQYYEPAKYVARLRARKTDRNPLLLAVNMQAGHGGSSGRFEFLNEVARMYAFLIDLAGAPPRPTATR
ncbi:MAG: S9 family peptidase [Rubrivivax sp.]|nr:S9 family peptidase [Rubrivivax sp.]